MKEEDDGPLVIEEGDLKEFMSSMWEDKQITDYFISFQTFPLMINLIQIKRIVV